jgi:hypothetical protein
MTDVKSRMPKTNTISKVTKINQKIGKKEQINKKTSGKVLKAGKRKINANKDNFKKTNARERQDE